MARFSLHSLASSSSRLAEASADRPPHAIPAFTMKHLLRFVPLLVLYLVLLIVFVKPHFVGDEFRYISYTDQLLETGTYTDAHNPVLRNGPGYPIFLLPFRALDAPKWLMALPNVFFLLLSVAYLYRILQYFAPRQALLGAYLFGLYYPLFLFIPKLSPATIGLFLITGFTFHYLQVVQSRELRWRPLLLAGLYMGLLIMAKFAFGYVLMVSLLLSALAFAIWRKYWLLRTVMMFGLGLALCIPYLGYTYSLTGRVMYWGTNGGEQFYWMTSPYGGEKEWGNWQSFENLFNHSIPELHEAHYEFYQEIKPLDWMARNDAFLAKGKENLAAHPEAYLKNWVANCFRLLFNYPNSFAEQNVSAYFYILPNMTILVLIMLAIYPGWVGRRHIPLEILPPTIFILIYLGATTLMNAVPRYFVPVVPFIIIWLTIIYSKAVTIKINA